MELPRPKALDSGDSGRAPLEHILGAPLELTRFLNISAAIAKALSQFHVTGLTHNDIRPQNLLLDAAGNVSFGGLETTVRKSSEARALPTDLTSGSLGYMAPEQTGRINRPVDARSDLYSLGMTFYEMLTGALPFAASDPLEWIHCHIARQPPRPSERVASIPAAVEAIVMKLIGKNPEERYQTAAALEADLNRCSRAFAARGQVDAFPLGEQDVPNRFTVYPRLLGREAEARVLRETIARVSTHGATEVVLISGSTGIGKSAILNELRRTLDPVECSFALGKSEQYGASTPLATLGRALQSMVRQLLIKKETELSESRLALQQALGADGQLIVTAVPELALIIGDQPVPPERPSRDAQERFYAVLKRFLAVVARPGHPLVLCFDDLQWLDEPTLALVERLVAEPELRHLLVIGTYRDREVDTSHRVMQSIERLRSGAAKLTEITLSPLTLGEITQLLSDGMRVERPSIERLSQFVFEKTAGNPLFSVLFITAMAEEELLSFDAQSGTWKWDLGRMHGHSVSSDVASVMASKVGRLPASTKHLLARMALLGGTAEVATLAQVASGSAMDVHVALWDAVDAGLIIRDHDSYRFVHDRVQESAYALMDEDERAAAHLDIGRRLVRQPSDAELSAKIFEIVQPFERSFALVESREERDQVAELNLLAGKRARSSAAYGPALAYFETGLTWLGADAWKRCPHLAFSLELQRAACEFLIGALPAAKEHLAVLARRPLELADLPALADVEVKVYTHSGESGRAVEACLRYLRERFDLTLPLHPTPAELRAEYDRVLTRLDGRAISSLIDLPAMRDPAARALIEVLSSLMAPAGIVDPKLTGLTMLHMVRISLEHGNCDPSCAAYAGMAQYLGPLFGDHQKSYEFVSLAVSLVETRGLTRFMSRVFGSYGLHVVPWLKHIREGYDFAVRASEVPAEKDLPTWSAYSWWSRAAIRFDSGDLLEEVHAEAQCALAFVTKLEFEFAIALVMAPLQLTRTLLGLTATFGSFAEEGLDEAQYERYLEANPALTHATFRYWVRKLQARYFAGDHPTALAAAAKAERLMAATLRTFEFAEYHFFAALAHAALSDPSAITAHLEQLRSWAAECPDNYVHRVALLEAELARLAGRELDAERKYEEAIALARDYAFIQVEALSNELAARFHAARGIATIANAYLTQARSCYERWGAREKARQLDLGSALQRRDADPPAPSRAIPLDPLDRGAMLRAAQALSGEIVLDSLIETLMRIAIEHAGAERGCLILLREGQPQMAAEVAVVSGQVVVTHNERPAAASDLPESALQYVMRTRDSLILDDASQDELFAGDAYVRHHQPKSVLCMPIVKQAKLVGVMYLQNKLTAHAFTPSRITVLEFVASQAAISLENAYLYADLQRSEAFLAEGQRLSHTASWSMSLTTGEVRWSDEHYRIFEWDPQSDPAPTWDSSLRRVHAEDRPMLLQKFELARRERSALSFDFRVDFGTRLKYLQGVGRPILNEAGEVEGFVGTTMDITERKHAEDALRSALSDLEQINRLTTMGELAASIAHEINQPLAAVAANAASCVSWLSKNPPNIERARAAAERIVRNNHNAADIVRSIRAMATKTPEMTALNLDEVLHEVIDLMQTEARRHEIQTTVELRGDALPIRGNRVQLQQVLVNLITNGIAAMKGSGHQRLLRVTRTNNDSREMVISVEDTGTGIESHVVERIFDPLFTTKREGLGMGLAICRSIVEAHSGRIWISPNEPQGSIFSFAVPVAAPAQPAAS